MDSVESSEGLPVWNKLGQTWQKMFVGTQNCLALKNWTWCWFPTLFALWFPWLTWNVHVDSLYHKNKRLLVSCSSHWNFVWQNPYLSRSVGNIKWLEQSIYSSKTKSATCSYMCGVTHHKQNLLYMQYWFRISWQNWLNRRFLKVVELCFFVDVNIHYVRVWRY